MAGSDDLRAVEAVKRAAAVTLIGWFFVTYTFYGIGLLVEEHGPFETLSACWERMQLELAKPLVVIPDRVRCFEEETT